MFLSYPTLLFLLGCLIAACFTAYHCGRCEAVREMLRLIDEQKRRDSLHYPPPPPPRSH